MDNICNSAVEARQSDCDLVGVLRDLRFEPGHIPSLTALSSIAGWAIPGDRADVAHALSSDTVQQIIAGDELGLGIKSQEDNGESEGEERVDRVRSSSSVTQEEMIHHLGRVRGFPPVGNDYDSLPYLHKIRNLHSTGT